MDRSLRRETFLKLLFPREEMYHVQSAANDSFHLIRGIFFLPAVRDVGMDSLSYCRINCVIHKVQRIEDPDMFVVLKLALLYASYSLKK